MYDTTHEYELDKALMEANRDNDAVDEFAKAMKEKLAKARAKGRRGWSDKEACSNEHLAQLFHKHLEKCNDGNFIDLTNFLMFLHVRGAKSNVLLLSCIDCVEGKPSVEFNPCYKCIRLKREDFFKKKDKN